MVPAIFVLHIVIICTSFLCLYLLLHRLHAAGALRARWLRPAAPWRVGADGSPGGSGYKGGYQRTAGEEDDESPLGSYELEMTGLMECGRSQRRYNQQQQKQQQQYDDSSKVGGRPRSAAAAAGEGRFLIASDDEEVGYGGGGIVDARVHVGRDDQQCGSHRLL